jgi:hypothetical protein
LALSTASPDPLFPHATNENTAIHAIARKLSFFIKKHLMIYSIVVPFQLYKSHALPATAASFYRNRTVTCEDEPHFADDGDGHGNQKSKNGEAGKDEWQKGSR